MEIFSHTERKFFWNLYFLSLAEYSAENVAKERLCHGKLG